MSRPKTFDQIVKHVHGGEIRFSGCNARKQRVKYEKLLADPDQQHELCLGWKRWEEVKEASMCHTADGVIRRLYEFFQCFEGQCDTQQYLQALDAILDRCGAGFAQKTHNARRVLSGVDPEQNNIVEDLVKEIERSSRPTLFWFLLKTPNANGQEIMAAYKQFSFSKTTTKLVAPLFLWMWRIIEKLVQNRLQLLQIVYEVVTCTYNQKTVTHLVPMKLLKDSKPVSKGLKRVVGLRQFVTTTTRKFPDEIDDILSKEILELKRRNVVKREDATKQEPADMKELEEPDLMLDDPYCYDEPKMSGYYPDEFIDVDAFAKEDIRGEQLAWDEFPDLGEDMELAQNSMRAPFDYSREFGNVPNMVEHDARVEIMHSQCIPPNDPLPEEEEKHALVTGVPVAQVFGAPAPTEQGLDRQYERDFFGNPLLPTPPAPIGPLTNVSASLNIYQPPFTQDDDVEMQEHAKFRGGMPWRDGMQYGPPGWNPPSAIGSFGVPWNSAEFCGNDLELLPTPPPIRPQEDLSARVGVTPPFGYDNPIPPPVVAQLNFENTPSHFSSYSDRSVSSSWPQPGPESVPQFANAYAAFGDTSGAGVPTIDRDLIGGTPAWSSRQHGIPFGAFGDGSGMANANGFPPPDFAHFGMNENYGRLDSFPLTNGSAGVNGVIFGPPSDNSLGLNGYPSSHGSSERCAPPGFDTQMQVAVNIPQFSAFGAFGSAFGPAFGGMPNGYGMNTDAAGDVENAKSADAGHMDVDFFMNPSMDVDHPPPEIKGEFLGRNDASFTPQIDNAIISGGSRQNDSFDLDQGNNPPDYRVRRFS